MLDTIRHRGPDDEGTYIAPQIGLGHRRLSIIDLNTGHQPLSNEDGTVWVVFNGEIYNFRELHTFLLGRGHVFSTKTDTEVIVHLYEELGTACLEKLRGMFAFAIWDEKKRALILARDRLGIKPLYYLLSSESLVFASEIKAILADPAVERDIAPEMVDRFLKFGYLPGEETLLKGVQKLSPGTYLLQRDGQIKVHQYWDLKFSRDSQVPSQAETEKQLLNVLGEAVELHMIADVPIGILLSGGLDSTAVLSLAAGRTQQEISTFTVGFAAPQLADERPYARLASETYGSRHYDMTISAADFAAFMPSFVWHMEEPVFEPPAVALYYISKLASSHVKVVLSGEGGDEAFAGYPNYRNLLWLERLKRCLSPFNRAATRAVSIVNALFRFQPLARYGPLMNAQFPDYYNGRTLYGNSGQWYQTLYRPEYAGAIDHEYAVEPLHRLRSRVKGQSTLDQMLYVDSKTWLPDDLLLKADKMTMANSIELRVPLLDHKVLEFAASLPDDFKIRGFTTKYIAKRALGRQVPKKIVRRRKVGFPVPYASWLRNELRDWLQEILFDRKTLARGYFEKACIEHLILDHQRRGDFSRELFSLAILELWHREFLEVHGR